MKNQSIVRYWSPCGCYQITEVGKDMLEIFDDFRTDNNVIRIYGIEEIDHVRMMTADFHDDKAIKYAFASYPTFNA